MQKEITEPTKIFHTDGKVLAAGWANNGIFEYNKSDSKMKNKIDELDCCFISSDKLCLFLSAENLGNKFSVKIALADLLTDHVISDQIIKKTIFSHYPLPDANNDELIYTDSQIQLQLTNTINTRVLKCDFIDFAGVKNLYFNVTAKKIDGDALNQIAPFENDNRYFYMKKFAPSYSVSGIIRFGGLEYTLNDSSARIFFDSARFSKPRIHNYQKLSCDCIINQKRFTLCLASRVGDNISANENCFFVDNRIIKLSQINVKSTNGRLDRPWYFKGGISALDITFRPLSKKGQVISAIMDKTTVIFGKLFGTINNTNLDEPIELDGANAHMIFTEF